ncbi:MAG TPA: TRZ/ATZ family hydrolase [Burkholderiales bacterium]|nr:TRZ/ATZ family hydrolase [Burkholderiales bacterium]
MPESIDSLIHAKWVIPVVPAGVVLHQHSLAIRQEKIIAIAPTSEAKLRFEAQQEFDLGDHAVIPGFINLHAHAAMSLMRGLADDLPLMTWLNEHIWPAEQQHVSKEFVFDGTLLACAEMLRGGVTFVNDMYFFPDAAARAILRAGMRATLGATVLEFPTGYAADADDYLHKGLSTRDEFKGESLLSFSLAPHAPYTISDRTFDKVLTLAEKLDCRIHMHVHETTDEIQGGLKEYGVRPLERLQKLGLLGPNLIAVHAVHLTDMEISVLARLGCHVAHCPASNLKLASGFSPIDKLLQQGANVGIGTDGSASNNRLDVMGEMRLAALLAKGVSGRADAAPADTALSMATINSARALGLDDCIGSLEIGKLADITAIDMSAPATSPCFDVISQIVYAASREQVSHVWVNGELKVKNGTLTDIDTNEVRAKAAYWQNKLQTLQ